MGEVVSIINGQPIIQGGRITSASKPEITVAPPPSDLFKVGDSFESNDGIRVHIMQSRVTDGRLEYLFSAHGTRYWLPANTFRRMA